MGAEGLSGRSRRVVRAVSACGMGALAVAALVGGMRLRFHVENTDAALAEESQGGLLLIGSAALFIGAAVAVWWPGGARWTAFAVALPVMLGIVPALLLPGNIIPFGTSLVSGIAAVVGLLAAARQAFT